MNIYGPYPNEVRRNRILDIKRVEGSDPEPVSLADIKTYLKIDFTDEDALISDIITACRQAVEEYCCISIVEKIITVTAEWSGEKELPYGPVKSVTSLNSLSNNVYELKTVNEHYYIDGEDFRTLRVNNCGRSKIVYVAGYNPVPKDLILDLKRIIAYCYEHRGDEALTSLQGGMERPKSLDYAMELFASKHARLWL